MCLKTNAEFAISNTLFRQIQATCSQFVYIANRLKQHLLDMHPYDLSGGEQQRAAFARAVINNPGILLADEPIANLDRDNGDVLIELLESLWKKGVTVICVSHDERMRKAEYDLLNIENLSLLWNFQNTKFQV